MEDVIFNNAQTLFLALFSILYGVMLQSTMGLGAFPLVKASRGYVKRDGKVRVYFRSCNKNGEQLKSMWKTRIRYSVLFLNVCPIAYLWFILSLLQKVKLSSLARFITQYTSVFPKFVNSISQLITIGSIFWAALAVFGFYRIYLAIAVKCWKTLFCDMTKELDKRVSYDAKEHLLWAIRYYLLPGIISIVVLNLLA